MKYSHSFQYRSWKDMPRWWRYTPLMALVLSLIWPIIAWAHPLGNFTINRYSRLTLEAEQIRLHYIVDMTEIPTVGESSRIDADGNGQFSQTEQEQYLGQQVYALRNNLQLQINGQLVELIPLTAEVTFPEGQGGLPTTRLVIDYIASLPAQQAVWQLDYQDTNYAGRKLGWQEIIIQPGAGISLLESTVPSEDISQALQAYPEALLQEPLQIREATARFEVAELPTIPSVEQEPSNQIAVPAEAAGSTPIVRSTANDPFADLITLPMAGVGTIILTMLAAFGWGAVHAFSPGHGKTVVAAYLVGTRGTPQHALFLGLTTTITHTAGVFALGGVTLFVSQYILPETLYPWLSVLSGLLVVILGISLITGRLRQRHHHHHHDHDHTHDHDHHHSHLPPGTDGTPVTWRSLLALGISGGLLPCPSALVVMLSAIALGRVGFGLILIFVFSLGLASVLTAIGLLFVYAGRLFEHIPQQRPIMQMLPLISALIVTLLGLGITIQALSQIGIFAIFI
ncbi:MAG: sulfite exporter TauE/SafE family protein [Chloroflexota bacterium]